MKTIPNDTYGLEQAMFNSNLDLYEHIDTLLDIIEDIVIKLVPYIKYLWILCEQYLFRSDLSHGRYPSSIIERLRVDGRTKRSFWFLTKYVPN